MKKNIKILIIILSSIFGTLGIGLLFYYLYTKKSYDYDKIYDEILIKSDSYYLPSELPSLQSQSTNEQPQFIRPVVDKKDKRKLISFFNEFKSFYIENYTSCEINDNINSDLKKYKNLFDKYLDDDKISLIQFTYRKRKYTITVTVYLMNYEYLFYIKRNNKINIEFYYICDINYNDFKKSKFYKIN